MITYAPKEAAVIKVLLAAEGPLTIAELLEGIEVTETYAQRTLRNLVIECLVIRSETGGKMRAKARFLVSESGRRVLEDRVAASEVKHRKKAK